MKQNYKENLNDHKTEEFIKVITQLRKQLKRINDSDRLDILMHMLLSKGMIDTINIKKDFNVSSNDYANLTKDDYIQTTKNILSELEYFEYELDGLIN